MKILFLAICLYLGCFRVCAETFYCIGPGLCNIVSRLIKPSILKKAKFVELPMSYSLSSLKQHKHIFDDKSLLFTYPPSSLGKWSNFIIKKHLKFSNSVFTIRQGELLPMVYRGGMDNVDILYKIDYKILHNRSNPFLPFYFYPLSLSNTTMDIYIFLKANTSFSLDDFPKIHEIDGVTYELEACLSVKAKRKKVIYIFSDNILSSFFRHLDIRLLITKNILKQKYLKSLKGLKKIVFFNYKGDRNRLLAFFGKDRVRFWDLSIFPDKPLLNPNLYLREAILSAFRSADLDFKQCP